MNNMKHGSNSTADTFTLANVVCIINTRLSGCPVVYNCDIKCKLIMQTSTGGNTLHTDRQHFV